MLISLLYVVTSPEGSLKITCVDKYISYEDENLAHFSGIVSSYLLLFESWI